MRTSLLERNSSQNRSLLEFTVYTLNIGLIVFLGFFFWKRPFEAVFQSIRPSPRGRERLSTG